MTTVSRVKAQAGMREDLAHLVRLVEEGRVEEARALAPVVAVRWPDSPEIQQMARVLEPPRIIPDAPGPRGRRFDRDHRWLQEHAHEYQGCWIATLEDQLLAADPIVERVMDAVQKAVDLSRELPLLHYEPARHE